MPLFRPKKCTLEGPAIPSEVYLEGRVASPNDVASPLGGGRAAFFQVVVGVRYTAKRTIASSDTDEVEVFQRLASEVFCQYLLIEMPGGLLAVTKDASFEFAEIEPLAVLPVSSALPGSLEPVARLPAANKGMLSYQVQSLSHGDPVSFKGWVTPFRSASAYRSGSPLEASWASAGVTHVADLEKSRAVVRDMSSVGEEFRQSSAMKLVSWILGIRR